MDDIRAHTGTLVADLLLPHAASLKERRAVLRSLVQRLRNLDLAVAQIGPPDLPQRVFLAVADVSGSVSHLTERLDAAERIIADSEFEVGALHRDAVTWSDSSGQ